MFINVVGAGLAGCEAAYQIAKRGIPVRLYEMKPTKKSPAHYTDLFAELVCSNSFKADRVASAAGLLKQEMRELDSIIVNCADKCRVPAGGALAVDRVLFSQSVTDAIKKLPNVTVISEEITEIPTDAVTVIATGPLTSDALSESISELLGNQLSFFDAAAPIVTRESIDDSCSFFASRYDKGGDDDYINCPLNKAEYELFYNELINAQRAPLHDFDVYNPKVYEGCMPIEVMAGRGEDTIRFGPMKPVGLRDPRTGHRPWACLQLRKENSEGTMYNLVGFQTNLKFGEQKRVFGLIPALKNAEYVRYGVMHRNTFINSPQVLNSDLSAKCRNDLFFAGQLTGVEGYMESTACGLLAGINAAALLLKKKTVVLPSLCEIGALISYITDETVDKFQPMGANFGILPPLDERPRDKSLRAQMYASRAIEALKLFISESDVI